MDFHVDFAGSRRAPSELSARGLLRALALVAGIGTAIVAYVVVFVHATKPLHLEFQAGYWLGFGGLSMLAGIVGMTPIVKERQAFRPIAVYLIVIGLVGAGFGAYRQRRIETVRGECAAALAHATNVHERVVVLSREARHLPSLSKGAQRRLTCRDLLD